ncbi:hypothetical protein RhiJN_12606 [Ceratobasidium sp. AG-Ba]|nr:hypothetical protein RhiJN_12606 [Ceratobasidium sp. AG-Ba]
MDQTQVPSLTGLASAVGQVWQRKEDHPEAAKLLGAPSDLFMCTASFDQTGHLVSLQAQNQWVYKVTDPAPGPATSSSDEGGIIWPQELVAGNFTFETIINDLTQCYIIITGGAVKGGTAFYAPKPPSGATGGLSGSGMWIAPPSN